MNAIGKKWMAKELYELCPICDGEGIVNPSHIAGLKPDPDNRGMAECPECKGEGFTKSGYTVGEIERTKAKHDLLLAACREAMTFLDRQGYDAGHCDAHGYSIRGTLQYAILKAMGK